MIVVQYPICTEYSTHWQYIMATVTFGNRCTGTRARAVTVTVTLNFNLRLPGRSCGQCPDQPQA